MKTSQTPRKRVCLYALLLTCEKVQLNTLAAGNPERSTRQDLSSIFAVPDVQTGAMVGTCLSPKRKDEHSRGADQSTTPTQDDTLLMQSHVGVCLASWGQTQPQW